MSTSSEHHGLLGDSFGSDDAEDEDFIPDDSEHTDESEHDKDEEAQYQIENPWAVSQSFTAEIFERGYRFPEYMTYKELYDFVNMKHQMDGGGEPLKTKGLFKNPEDHLPYQISFYCPHGRQHVHIDKLKVKEVKNPASSRANRDIEDRRSAYSQCKYKMNIRLDTDHVVQHSVEDGDRRGLKSLTKARWFVDSTNDFTKDPLRRNFVPSCFCHSGHCKKTLPTGLVTDSIRGDIHSLGRSCVPVASIAARVFEIHKIYLTYQQIHYELSIIGITVRKGGVVSAHLGARKNACDALLDWLRNEDDQTWVALVENIDESSEDKIVFETWHGGHSDAEELLSETTYFEYNSVLKPKDSSHQSAQELINGRQYDCSRFVQIGSTNAKRFLIGIAWAGKDECRVCAAYPEVLVVDSKANTNKFKHAFFCGVGIDGNNNNSVLFRAWIPNNTQDSYVWLFNTALRMLFKPDFLKRIQVVMSDNCHTMGPVLEDACSAGEVLPNASAFICVYHIERNFHADFGVSSRGRWNLKPSITKKKKGGKIEWAYGWQKQCVSAIYQMQKCESIPELVECKKWIARFISTSDMTSDCRRSVRMFFQRKYGLRSQWVLAFRLKRRSYDIAASCRVEGEFGVINGLNLSGAMNFRTGITKMRFSSSNRHRKKIHRVERWCGTKVIRKAKCPISAIDFSRLDNDLTPFYRNSVEKQIGAADKYLLAQLVEVNGEHEMIFRVWSPTAHGDDNISESDGSSSDSSGNDEMEDATVPQAIAAYPHDEAHADFDDPDEEIVVTTAPSASTTAQTFRWLRVRTVQVTFCEATNSWILKCSCGCLERTCTPCRHTFCVIKLMIQNYGVKYLRFNRRCYKGFYHMVLCSADDFVVADGEQNVYVSIPNEIIQVWISGCPVASWDNVPQEGVPGNLNDGGHCDQSGMEGDDNINFGHEPRRPGQSKRRSANAASINQDVLNILDLLGPVSNNQTGYNHFSDYLKTYGETLSREPRLAVPGRARQNRIIGVSDFQSGSRPAHHSRHSALPGASQSQHQHAAVVHPALNAPTEQETALATLHKRLKLKGVKDGNYIEVFPAPGTIATDRWFLKVVDGSVVGKSLKACAWCDTNSLRLDSTHKQMITMEIKAILNEGPADQFEVMGSKGRVLPNILKAPAIPVIIPRHVKAKPPAAVGGSSVNAVALISIPIVISDGDTQVGKKKGVADSVLKTSAAGPVLKKRAGASQYCTCDGALTCDYCLQFEL
jgi:hypothetical protein